MATILQFNRRRSVTTDDYRTPVQAQQSRVETVPHDVKNVKMVSASPGSTQRDHFENLFKLGKGALDRLDLVAALEIFDEARQWARQWGDAKDVDRAECSRYGVLLRTGDPAEIVTRLRMVLMRSNDALNQYLAASHLSVYYEFQEDFGKSRFYADRALAHVKEVGSNSHLAAAFCHLGNLRIRESLFSEAFDFYERSWNLFTEDEVYRRLIILANMGFCHLACGRFAEGFEKLFIVRRSYRRMQMRPSTSTGRLRLAFCFGYLEMEKFHQAILHGKAALHIGEECGDRDVIKKTLYLLGEAEKQIGDEMKAFTYYAYLQEEFYPDQPTLPELLLYSDTNKLVNVWA